MKKIAVITGASSGMGRRFAETVDSFDRFDEVWVIARHEKALEELRDRVPYPIRALALDLTDRRSFQTYADALAEEPVEVGLLVNASGFGKFRAVVDTPLEVNLNMTDLNCQAVVALCQLTAPYMPRGGQIINIASVAAFQPIPYVRGHQGLCAELQPGPEPGAAEPGRSGHGPVPLLDPDGLLCPGHHRGRRIRGEEVCGHV
mgnify:CR=1 FL=1